MAFEQASLYLYGLIIYDVGGGIDDGDKDTVIKKIMCENRYVQRIEINMDSILWTTELKR